MLPTTRSLVGEFLATLRVVGLDRGSAEEFGRTKALLESEGRGLADAHLLVGAIALTHGATAVTGNTRHMQRIPGLTVENWIPSETQHSTRSPRARR
jgi:tRNA(fMet)-specific endonuclease VapC